MDEATSALDNENEKKILEIIKDIKKDMIIVIISHNLNMKIYCDKIYQIKNKKLIQID